VKPNPTRAVNLPEVFKITVITPRSAVMYRPNIIGCTTPSGVVIVVSIRVAACFVSGEPDDWPCVTSLAGAWAERAIKQRRASGLLENSRLSRSRLAPRAPSGVHRFQRPSCTRRSRAQLSKTVFPLAHDEVVTTHPAFPNSSLSPSVQHPNREEQHCRHSGRAPKLRMFADYAALDREGKWGSAMLSWLRRRRERAERIDAQASALIRAFGVDAYSEARQRKRQAESAEAAQEWRRIARVIAHKTGTRVGLDTATRMAMDADFSAARQQDGARKNLQSPEVDQLEELRRIISEG
jgi:hypothetical protein